MANRPAASFSFIFQGDGTSTSVQVDFIKDPISFNPSSFKGSPSSVSNISGGSLTITSSSVSSGALTLTFSSVPDNGTLYTISGFAEF